MAYLIAIIAIDLQDLPVPLAVGNDRQDFSPFLPSLPSLAFRVAAAAVAAVFLLSPLLDPNRWLIVA